MLRHLLAVCVALSALPCTALAEEGGVHFTGRVAASTCEVEAASRYLRVPLGGVHTDGFAGRGAPWDSQDFEIGLQCHATADTPMPTVRVRLEALSGARDRFGVLQLGEERDAASEVVIGWTRAEHRESEPSFSGRSELRQVSAAAGTLARPLRRRHVQVGGKLREGRAHGRATFAIEYL